MARGAPVGSVPAMTSKRTTTTMLIATLATASAASLATGLDAGHGQDPTASDQTVVAVDLAWRERERSFTFLDEAPRTRLTRAGQPRRFSPGDGFVSSKWMLDERRRRIGRVEERCTITNRGRRIGALRSVCVGVVVLGDSQLHASFSPDFASDAREAAVTGGTGAYAGATGTIFAREGDAVVHASLLVPR
jgi:hypothetical protein